MPSPPEVRASVHPGGGKAAYFADLTIGSVTILGCPVWNGTPGFYKLAMPAKKGDKDKWFRIVDSTRKPSPPPSAPFSRPSPRAKKLRAVDLQPARSGPAQGHNPATSPPVTTGRGCKCAGPLPQGSRCSVKLGKRTCTVLPWSPGELIRALKLHPQKNGSSALKKGQSQRKKGEKPAMPSNVLIPKSSNLSPQSAALHLTTLRTSVTVQRPNAPSAYDLCDLPGCWHPRRSHHWRGLFCYRCYARTGTGHHRFIEAR